MGRFGNYRPVTERRKAEQLFARHYDNMKGGSIREFKRTFEHLHDEVIIPALMEAGSIQGHKLDEIRNAFDHYKKSEAMKKESPVFAHEIEQMKDDLKAYEKVIKRRILIGKIAVAVIVVVLLCLLFKRVHDVAYDRGYIDGKIEADGIIFPNECYTNEKL